MYILLKMIYFHETFLFRGKCFSTEKSLVEIFWQALAEVLISMSITALAPLTKLQAICCGGCPPWFHYLEFFLWAIMAHTRWARSCKEAFKAAMQSSLKAILSSYMGIPPAYRSHWGNGTIIAGLVLNLWVHELHWTKTHRCGGCVCNWLCPLGNLPM